MLSISRYLTERSSPGDIFFTYTCRTPSDFILGGEVAALQRRNAKLRVAVSSLPPKAVSKCQKPVPSPPFDARS